MHIYTSKQNVVESHKGPYRFGLIFCIPFLVYKFFSIYTYNWAMLICA